MIKNKNLLLSLLLLVSTLEINATSLERTGWNLISICQDINSSDINMTNITEIQNQNALSIYTGLFSSFSNLLNLEAGYAYWIEGTTGHGFDSGETNNTLERPLLRDDWNLMGSCQDQNISKINMASITEIQNQNGLSFYTGSAANISNLKELRKGYGYWVKGEKGTMFSSYTRKDNNTTNAPLRPTLLTQPTLLLRKIVYELNCMEKLNRLFS